MREITKQAIVAALYAVLTLVIPVLSYGPIQFRFSEMMTLLAFYDRRYVVGLTIGCALSNLASPYGMIDIVVGTLATFLAVTAMSYCKNIWVASLMPAIFNILIGVEIYYFSGSLVNFFVVSGQIMFSEFVIVTILGVPIFKKLAETNTFRRYIMAL